MLGIKNIPKDPPITIESELKKTFGYSGTNTKNNS